MLSGFGKGQDILFAEDEEGEEEEEEEEVQNPSQRKQVHRLISLKTGYG